GVKESIMFKDRVVNLPDTNAVEGFLEKFPTSVLFKAGTCHKTMQGFGFVQEKLETREDMMVGIIRVVEARPASNLVTDKTGIRHESPQVILFKDGEAVFDVDNWNITPEVLDQALALVPASGEVVQSDAQMTSDLTPYKHLLEQYLTGMIDDRQFEFSYTTLFRDDASLRSRGEVEVLGSIFGDVDRHMEMHMMMGGRSNADVIRERAEAAYEALKVL
ncbi:MAG: monothiol bacilliredoxin BrxC family protein, partial [Deinococcota bacterium]